MAQEIILGTKSAADTRAREFVAQIRDSLTKVIDQMASD